MPDGRLKISVVVVALNEERNIRSCLESLVSQSHPAGELEILVVDNGSSDSTRDIVRELIASQALIGLAEQPRPGIAPSRNLGLRQARYDHVAFLDADCTAEPGWLEALEQAMRSSLQTGRPVAAVGGPSLAPTDTTHFRTAVDIAVRNFWGHHGSVQGRLHDQPVPVEHLPTLNVLYDRRAVLDIGGFDEGMRNIGEDIDLSHRLLRGGHRLLYVPNAAVRHRWREDPWSWARNMEVYGKGRTWMILKHPACFRWRYLAPVLLLVAALAAPWGLRRPLLAAPFGFYLTLTAAISLAASLSARRPEMAPLVFITYLLTHLSYGIGLIHGLLPRRHQ